MLRTCCGENRIRTYETLLGFTRFPGVPLQPLEHLSNFGGCIQVSFLKSGAKVILFSKRRRALRENV